MGSRAVKPNEPKKRGLFLRHLASEIKQEILNDLNKVKFVSVESGNVAKRR